jgi:MFS family permease
MDHFKEPMTRLERRVSLTLAHVFALRMLGFFIVLPVLAEYARLLPGGQSGLLVGLAMGAAGLAQACLQIPMGWASDRFGRRRVITLGLACVIVGSLVCAFASEVQTLIAGRILQGCGAVSAAISALVADHTRESQRTKAMALVGIGIGLSFTVSLALAPWLYARAAMAGIFLLAALLALASIGLVATVPSAASGAGSGMGAAAPPELGLGSGAAAAPQAGFGSGAAAAPEVRLGPGAALGPGKAPLLVSLQSVGRDPRLWRLDLGIFVLNAVQMAMFVVVPGYIVRSIGMPLAEHWRLYLPIVLVSFAVALPLLRRAESRSALGRLMHTAVWILLAVQLGWVALMQTGGVVANGGPVAADAAATAGAPTWAILPAAIILLAFFVAFNVLEAALPAQVSRVAASTHRGTAMGVFNTAQSLGLFAGGALGGLLGAQLDSAGVFLCCGALLGALLFAIGKEGFSTPGYQAKSAVPPASSPGVAGST